MKAELMALQQVVFGYDHRKPAIVEGFNLSINEGSITAILGPNGVGKTTLLNLVLGWLKPWSGKITLNGKSLEHYSRRAMGKQIALIPQSEHTPFEYSVLEYVLLGRMPHMPPLGLPSSSDETAAYMALEKVGIAHLSEHSIIGISGGERQLVLVARALAQQTKILLLDEPTSHLDLSNKSRLLHILQGLKENGTTILMTTHEPDIALALSDQAVLMANGHILAAGWTNEVITGETLTQVYNLPVRIIALEGKKQALWL